MKINKKTIVIYIIVLCVALIMCWNYVKMHWANDTYTIYNTGYYEYRQDKGSALEARRTL